jgi:CO/xanthine dehydrogenase Mo-binding subunit
MTGGSGAEVEVDTETGRLRILRLVNVADCGTPINPKIVETQLTGAAVMQLGFTLSEEMVFTDGQLRNPHFADYKIPGIRDMPERLEGEAVASRQESGPYGAKGVGETGTFGVSPAVANAIEDAVSVRITELPITPEAVLRAIRAAAGDPLEDQ